VQSTSSPPDCAIDGCLVCSLNGTCERCDSNYQLTPDNTGCERDGVDPTVATDDFPTALVVGNSEARIICVLIDTVTRTALGPLALITFCPGHIEPCCYAKLTK
jgi:hypothetical protein